MRAQEISVEFSRGVQGRQRGEPNTCVQPEKRVVAREINLVTAHLWTVTPWAVRVPQRWLVGRGYRWGGTCRG